MQRKAFTLVELMVSILVLLAIIAATARIFGATSKVASLGEANADMETMATAVERTIRRDVARMNSQGFLTIQCVAVRNDVNRSLYSLQTAPLLDPSRASTDFLRCDQVTFLSRGQEPTKNFEGSASGDGTGSAPSGYSVETYKGANLVVNTEGGSWEQLIRLGHGLQFPQLVSDPKNPTKRPDAEFFKYNGKQGPTVPWAWQPPGAPVLSIRYFDNTAAPTPATAYAMQPEARRWTLSRQATLLADDGGSAAQDGPLFYRGSRFTNMPINSAPNLAQKTASLAPDYTAITTGQWIDDKDLFPDRFIGSGRVDVAATTRAGFKSMLETGKDLGLLNGPTLPWIKEAVPGGAPVGAVRDRLLNSMFGSYISPPTTTAVFSMEGMWGWPRAERSAPSMNRADLMTTAGTLAGNCSWFQVDWTWSEGTGRQLTSDGTPQSADALPDSVNANRVSNVPLPGLMITNWPKWGSYESVKLSSNVKRGVPWFGLPDSLFPFSQRSGVTMLGGGLASSAARPLASARNTDQANSYATPIQILNPETSKGIASLAASATDLVTVAVAAPPIDAARIEGTRGLLRPMGDTVPVYVYQAAFGFNGDRAYTTIGRNSADSTLPSRVMRSDYTPWPTALRFTYTLHDPKLTMETGRTYQVIVELPRPNSP
jgi:type II secretory pathway pseudopilin PulG